VFGCVGGGGGRNHQGVVTQVVRCCTWLSSSSYSMWRREIRTFGGVVGCNPEMVVLHKMCKFMVNKSDASVSGKGGHKINKRKRNWGFCCFRVCSLLWVKRRNVRMSVRWASGTGKCYLRIFNEVLNLWLSETNSMEQSIPWQNDSHSADQEITHLLWNSKIH